MHIQHWEQNLKNLFSTERVKVLLVDEDSPVFLRAVAPT